MRIDLDPDFRVADDGEIKLLQQDVLADMLEEYFAAGDEEFLSCVEYFAPAGKEKRLEEQILGLYEFAMSYPWPGEWLTGIRMTMRLRRTAWMNAAGSFCSKAISVPCWRRRRSFLP